MWSEPTQEARDAVTGSLYWVMCWVCDGCWPSGRWPLLDCLPLVLRESRLVIALCSTSHEVHSTIRQATVHSSLGSPRPDPPPYRWSRRWSSREESSLRKLIFVLI